ncbi:MAG TPA: electron transfer flavoprotein subunit beta/FixA family protein [Anaerovoracaceae bacterium]|nr:electron transfer flavoprotein subunit beta/FixA family protein [Anaerovoracaceae bacterium]
MEILVCIKQVPGTTKVEVDPETGVLKRAGVDSKMNPYDLYALETAFRLKERHGGRVCVVSMGPPQAAEVIREAYMMGADEGALITDRSFAGSDVLATSHTLSEGIKMFGGFDLILCGKQTTDGDTAQVGPETAESLGIPHISNVLRIAEIKEKSAVVEMDMGSVVQTAEVQFPCLLTVEKDIFQPRLPSYRRKKDVADREIRILALEDLSDTDEGNYGLNGSPTQVERIFPPEVVGSRELWTGTSGELSAKMAEKLKELKFI